MPPEITWDHRHYPVEGGLEYVAALYEFVAAVEQYGVFEEAQQAAGAQPGRDGYYPGPALDYVDAAWRVKNRLGRAMDPFEGPEEAKVWSLLNRYGVSAYARYEGIEDDPEGRILYNGLIAPQPMHRYVLELRHPKAEADVEFHFRDGLHCWRTEQGVLPGVRGLLELLATAQSVYAADWSEQQWINNLLYGSWAVTPEKMAAARSWWAQASGHTEALRDFFGGIGGIHEWMKLYDPPF